MTAPGAPPPAVPRSPLRWFFEDRATGRIVVAQWPNLPLWIAIAGVLVQVLLRPPGRPGLALTVVIALALVWWGADEVIRGCNPWRRFLGVVALAFQVWFFWPR